MNTNISPLIKFPLQIPIAKQKAQNMLIKGLLLKNCIIFLFLLINNDTFIIPYFE